MLIKLEKAIICGGVLGVLGDGSGSALGRERAGPIVGGKVCQAVAEGGGGGVGSAMTVVGMLVERSGRRRIFNAVPGERARQDPTTHRSSC